MKSYTKYWQSVVAIMMLSGLIFSSLTASAAGSIVYEQSPGHDGGFGSDGPGIAVADEFRLDQPTLITTITWWGGYTTRTSPSADNFTVQLFADNGGQPGALLQSFAVGNNAARTATGDFVNPPDPDTGFEGIPEFQYSFDLPAPFSAEANTLYWLSIVNVPADLPAFEGWLWEDSLSPLHPGVQRMFNNDGLWHPFPGNIAFQLQGSIDTRPLTVEIDIKPGSFPNTIHLRSRGSIPVAILSGSTFDAPSQVDTTSLTFGRTGDEQSLTGCLGRYDVNGDGRLDLVCNFAAQATGFQLGDLKGVLKGKTVFGQSLIGTDSVRIVP